MRVVVTQKDIDNGIKGNALYCPIAHAMKRRFKNTPLMVYPDVIYVGPEGEVDVYKMPPKVTEWIRYFDQYGAGYYAIPFWFELPTPVKMAHSV